MMSIVLFSYIIFTIYNLQYIYLLVYKKYISFFDQKMLDPKTVEPRGWSGPTGAEAR